MSTSSTFVSQSTVVRRRYNQLRNYVWRRLVKLPHSVKIVDVSALDVMIFLHESDFALCTPQCTTSRHAPRDLLLHVAPRKGVFDVLSFIHGSDFPILVHSVSCTASRHAHRSLLLDPLRDRAHLHHLSLGRIHFNRHSASSWSRSSLSISFAC